MRFPLIVAVAILAAPAFVEPAVAGKLTFASKDGSGATVEMKSRSGGHWAVAMSTFEPPPTQGAGGCGGSVDGDVVLARDAKAPAASASYAGTLNVANPAFDSAAPGDDPMTSPRNCQVRLTIVGKTISTEELGGCLYFHGASCDFESTDLPLSGK